MAELREGLELARECLLVQREHAAVGKVRALDPASARPEQVAAPVITPAQVSTSALQEQVDAVTSMPSVEAVTAEARPVDAAAVAANEVPAPGSTPPPELARVVPLQPRGRYARTLLAAVLGLAAGVGGTLATRPGLDAAPAAERTALATRLELELARASAAEQRADRCKAEAARHTSAEVPTPPPTPSRPLLAPTRETCGSCASDDEPRRAA